MWKVRKQIPHKIEVNAIMWNQEDSVLFIADSHGKINLYDGQILEATSPVEPQYVVTGGH
jgi:hypothetical protein